MSQSAHSSPLGIYLRIAGAVALVLLAIVLGLWLGGKSVRFNDDERPERPATESRTADPAAPPDTAPPPLFFSVNLPSGAGQIAAIEELTMAANAGIHQFVIGVPLPWQGDAETSLAPLRLVLQTDPAALMLVYLKLDPPPAWLAAHPDEAAHIAGKDPVDASLASEMWQRDADAALDELIKAIHGFERADSVFGYVLAALEGGCWYRSDGYDSSPANAAGFRRWLKTHYKEDAALQAAWGNAQATLETAAMPGKPDTAAHCPGFFDLPQQQAQVDYLQYVSENTATTVSALAGFVKQAAGSEAQVIVPYGFSYELKNADAGHFALFSILDGLIDGFASPVSYVDRGLGGAGGIMGPVDSALAHGKSWYLIDDTRTGMARDPVTGEVTRPKNLRAEDVYCVQQRNFAAAATHGLGLFWSDPEGDGWLHDPEMWQRFAKMDDIYRKILAEQQKAPAAAPPSQQAPILAVVVDENSRFYQQCDRKANEVLLTQARDSALRAGVRTRFYLLRDVLDQRAPAASVYLFLNAFHLRTDERAQLQVELARNRAAAIWMYAPGYIDTVPAVANIAETTRIKAKMFDGTAQSGSVSLLPGRWIAKDEEFGTAQEWDPLFYIDDPQTDVLAKFRASKKASVAVRFFEEGWASIFCAEPALPPALLRDILGILELRICFQAGPKKFYDTTCFGPDLFAIHAKETGERTVDLDRVYDVQDLLAPEIGWPRKRTFSLSLKTGETRLLKLTPVEAEEAP